MRDEPEIYSRYDVDVDGDLVRVTFETNDDDDDGVVDEVVRQELKPFTRLVDALRFTGPPRVGIWGHRVIVAVNGDEITRDQHDSAVQEQEGANV